MEDNTLWLVLGLGACLLLLVGWRRQRARASERQQAALRERQAKLARQAADAERQARERAQEQARAQAQALIEREREREVARLAEQAARQAAEQATAKAHAEQLAAQAAEARAAEQAARDAAEQAAARQAEALLREQAEQQAARELARRQAAEAAAAAQAASAVAVTPLPLQQPDHSAAPGARKAPEQTLVLVADDSKTVRVKTGRLLARFQYRVAFAVDGHDALQQMQAEAPDVVITDVEMPGMDGFELTRQVRHDPRMAQVPVIMITSADDRHRDEAQRAGVSVLLGKPYPEEELIAHIQHALQPGQALAALS